MFLVVPNEDKPRRLMLYVGFLWVISNFIVIGYIHQINSTHWLLIFPALAIPYAFIVAWYIPGKDIYNWISIPVSWAAWYAAGLAILFALEQSTAEYRISTHLFPSIGYGLLLVVFSLPVYCVAYLFVHFIRTFPQPVIHCRHCSYDLTGNTSGICPECGQTIDFADQQILKKKQAQSVENHSEHSGE